MVKHYETHSVHPYSLRAFKPYQENNKRHMVWEIPIQQSNKQPSFLDKKFQPVLKWMVLTILITVKFSRQFFQHSYHNRN